MSLVVGVDVGATSTKALAMRLDGEPLGRGTSGGANPNAHPPELAARRVAEAVAAALGPHDPVGVRHCVLGMAGDSKLSDPVIGERFRGELVGIGLRCPVTTVSDAEVAFASATPEPDGTVLIAGTGSIALRIAGRRKQTVVGGYGWLLGDEGSAYWIGRAAVRSTLDLMVSGATLGPLAAAVLSEALGAGWERARYGQLITAANAEAPIRLARFAALVGAHATEDPAAGRIVAEAAELLVAQALRTRSPGDRTPAVLAGSVVAPGSPVGDAVRAILDRSGVPVLFAADGADGAAWLAALDVLGPAALRPRTGT